MPGHAVYRLIILQYGRSEELEYVRCKYVYEDFCAFTTKSYKDAWKLGRVCMSQFCNRRRNFFETKYWRILLKYWNNEMHYALFFIPYFRKSYCSRGNWTNMLCLFTPWEPLNLILSWLSLVRRTCFAGYQTFAFSVLKQ